MDEEPHLTDLVLVVLHNALLPGQLPVLGLRLVKHLHHLHSDTDT